MPKKTLILDMRWWQEGMAVAIILLVVVIVFTWPLVLHIRKAIPSGSEPPAVALVQLFMPEWTGMVLEQGKSYWNAPVQYPYPGTFAWTEPQLFTCVLIWLISKITGFVAAYNIVVLLYMVGFGLSGYATARLFTSDLLSALWCAVWLTGSAYCLQQMCALNIIAAAFPGACFYFCFLFVKNGKQRFLWLAFLWYLLTWATCKQTFLFLSILLPFALWPFFSWKKPAWSTVINGLLAMSIVMVIILPSTLRQLSYLKEMGFQLGLGGISGVLKAGYLFLPAKGHWLTTHVLGWGSRSDYHSWDIGIMCLLIIMIAIFIGIGKSGALNTFRRKLFIGLFSMIVVALVLGFGPKKFSPYGFLYSIIPGFKFVRVPWRFAKFAIFAVAVLSTPAFAYIQAQIKTKTVRYFVAISLFIFLFAEMWTMPIALVYPEKEIQGHCGVISWLHENGKGGAVVELPMPEGIKIADLEIDAAAMLRALLHGNPVVNGYFSYFPTSFKQLRRAMFVDPKGQGLRYLIAYGVRYAVVHNETLTDEQRRVFSEALGNDVVYSEPTHFIYRLPQAMHTEELATFLPANAEFRHAPKPGKYYGLSLFVPRPEAFLLTPQSGLNIELSWKEEKGGIYKKKARILGGIILDSNDPELYFRLLRVSANEALIKLVAY